MGIRVDCDYCGEEMAPGSDEYLRYDAFDPATSREIRLGVARLHHDCAKAVERLLRDHVDWVRGGGSSTSLRWQLAPTDPRIAVEEGRRPTSGDEALTRALLDMMGFRAMRALRRAGIKTVGQLADTSDADLLAIPDIGPKALREIHDALAQLGYQREEVS